MYLNGLWLFELCNDAAINVENLAISLLLLSTITIVLSGEMHSQVRLLALLFVFLGSMTMYLKNNHVLNQNQLLCLESDQWCEIQVLAIKKHSSGQSSHVLVKHPCYSKIIHATYYADSLSKFKFTPGLVMAAHGKLNFIQNRNNPGEFDKERYFLTKGITHVLNLTADTLISFDTVKTIYSLTDSLKNLLQEVIQPFSSDERTWSLIHALLFADKRFFQREDLDKFSKTGTMHLLAVSGMHMGLLFWSISFFLSGLRILKIPRAFIYFISIVMLFLFSIMIGFGASVKRAFAMISILLFSKVIHKKTHGLVSLSLAGFIIVLSEPYVIYDVGFQLSFCAVASLLSIPYLRNQEVQSKFSQAIKGLVIVSIIAQLGTTPITLYHFDLFPVYFLLANVVIIPMVIVLMYVLLLYMLVSSIEFMQQLIESCIHFLVKILFSVLDCFSALPHSTLSGLNVSYFLMILGMIILFFWFTYRNNRIHLPTYFWIALIICIVWNFIIQGYQRINNSGYVLNSSGSFQMLLKTKSDNILLTHDLKKELIKKEIFKTMNKTFQLTNLMHISLDSVWNKANNFPAEFFMTNRGKRVLVIGDIPIKTDLISSLSTDYLILTKDTKLNFQQLQKIFSFHLLIIADTPHKKLHYWRTIANKRNDVILVAGKESFKL